MSFVRRALVLIVAAALAGAVVAAAEQARPGYTPLGKALGLWSRESRLAGIADSKIARGTPPGADDLAFARRVATTAPLSALPFYILGADAQAHDPTAAMAAAIRRDPRLLPAYGWQAEHAARAGDIADATRALIRLASLSPTESARYWPAIVQLTADPAARAVIKREMAREPLWRDSYLEQLSGSSVDRAVVFEMLQSSGRTRDAAVLPLQPGRPDDRRAFIAQMVARKDYERAYLAWVQWLPAASQDGMGHVFDSSFKGLPALQPFTWTFGNGVGGATAIDAANGLALDYSGTDGATLAQQTLLLGAGRYRIVTQARFDATAADGATPPLVWTLTCIADQHVLTELAVPLDVAAKRVAGQTFAVAQSCPAQTLVLRANPADFAKRLSGSIRSVTVEAMP